MAVTAVKREKSAALKVSRWVHAVADHHGDERGVVGGFAGH